MAKMILRFSLLTLLFVFGSCQQSMLSAEQVKADFLKEHPTDQVLNVNLMAGDPYASVYQIRYKKSGSDEVLIDTWHYLREESGKMKVLRRETKPEVAKERGSVEKQGKYS